MRRAITEPRTEIPHSRYSALCLSAEQGCNFCRLLRQALVYEFSVYETPDPPAGNAQISLSARVWKDGARLGNLAVICNGRGSAEIEVLYDPPSEQISTFSLVPNFADLVSMIQSWVIRCLETHTMCHTPGNEPNATPYGGKVQLPTRVIDVGSRDPQGGWPDPKIHITQQEERGIYTALSYQWGVKSHSCRTTESTLTSFKQGIPWNIMPKTMQDAIIVTREMGVRYVWIDALCIVQAHQGNDGDWRSEAENIGSYYRNALVTLSAVSALTCHEGFLGPRPQTTYSISDPYILIEDTTSRAHRYLVHLPKPYYTAEITHSKLQRRGWVVQERLFSSRMVHFGHRFVSWECSCQQAPEWDPEGHDEDSQEGADDSSMMYKIQSWLARPREEQLTQVWTSFIEYYTTAQLTYHSDRLVAVSSLVKTLEEAYEPKPRYMVGLWEESLPLSLAWSSSGLDDTRGNSYGDQQFPSWSWASHGRIDFDAHRGSARNTAQLEGTFPNNNGPARLRLKSILKPLALMLPRLDPRDMRLDGWEKADFLRCLERDAGRFLLAMICLSTESFQALILEKSQSETLQSDRIVTYKRLGLLKHDFLTRTAKNFDPDFGVDGEWTIFDLI
ncbi:hypothetical protein PFICI_13760 [Pestalotiopsis fici W106-1]|uniref:Heterokaryon incompatibility domain-containing protein n=1 Tax=Pestalotiopsis fici (strain W106-1 / CGMCC3.15140) TaxID=1229662 RepID=W3WJF2_PESFW|nr:uncharacterized protein PFICI_13760 [Pestalotiopsis fici W106-1]ETS73894.1 hypothetical protein PFICI_13760 [Pestalotiopsis fici W106-1]